jgi:hypothetical protein
MNAPHVHAAMIHAYADGAEIQAKAHNHNVWKTVEYPSFLTGFDYRVKVTIPTSLLEEKEETEILYKEASSAEWEAQNETCRLADALEVINRRIEAYG